jgi:putative peptide maturation dehydrogenase
MRLRRTAYAFFYLEDDLLLDVTAMLQGSVPRPAPQARTLAIAILTGERRILSRAALDLLLSVPAERWVDGEGHDPNVVAELTQAGLLLSDAGDEGARRLRERDEALSGNQWNLYAALYHYMTQWSGIEIREGEEDDAHLSARTRAAARALVAEHGYPPDAFAPRRPGQAIPLPGRPRSEDLYRVLTERRTTRSFDPDTPMTIEQLDTVLTYVFGCHGYTRTAADVVCIKRTSPSGGGLHPIEVYPIVSHVAGVPAGIYHYNGRDHSLEPVRTLDLPGARQTATSFMCGQSYFGSAHVSFVLTARFYRSHWKYRRHQKAYAGLLMDAAHLSQTLYLVSTDLDLGAYVTIAINARDIERDLDLDGVSEGVLAMAGCGPRGAGGSPLEPRFSSDPV